VQIYASIAYARTAVPQTGQASNWPVRGTSSGHGSAQPGNAGAQGKPRAWLAQSTVMSRRSGDVGLEADRAQVVAANGVGDIDT